MTEQHFCSITLDLYAFRKNQNFSSSRQLQTKSRYKQDYRVAGLVLDSNKIFQNTTSAEKRSRTSKNN